jgi:hypothetical protein
MSGGNFMAYGTAGYSDLSDGQGASALKKIIKGLLLLRRSDPFLGWLKAKVMLTALASLYYFLHL